MGYVALKHLKWGDEMLAPGDPVPEEEGRNYASLVRSGRIAEVHAPEEMSDEQLVSALKEVTEERDELQEKVDAAGPIAVDVPDGVTPGETPGWPVDEAGDPHALPDEVRTLIVSLEEEVATLREQVTACQDAESTQAAEGGEGSTEEASSGSEETEGTVAGGLAEGVKALGGGYYELPGGEKVRGRAAVDAALTQAAEGGEG